MDLIQLYTATQRVVTTLKTSGLMPALKSYRASLHGVGDRDTAVAAVRRASDDYIDKTLMFGDDEAAVVNLLHLGQLGTASFWLDLTSDTRPVEARQAQSVSAYSKMMFATNHLPGLIALVRDSSAIDGLRSDDVHTAPLVVRLYDSVEPAASPDRMARLIDAVDMLYRACAAVSGHSGQHNGLQLMSVSGVAIRSVVFHGDARTISATRVIIAWLNKVAGDSHNNADYSVEKISASMPFIQIVAEITKPAAIDEKIAYSASSSARDSAIMLLECGAQLVQHDADTMQTSVIAGIDADVTSFDAIDNRINGTIDDRYDAAYQRERARLVNEPPVNSEVSSSVSGVDSELSGIEAVAASVRNEQRARGDRRVRADMLEQPAAERVDDNDDRIVDLKKRRNTEQPAPRS